MDERRNEIVQRITGYLASGGLFNPELANHDAVRDLLIECRDALLSTAPSSASSDRAVSARRYERLRVLGCAPGYSKQLENGTVLRFQGLDEYVDADLKLHPSRGEATLPAAPKERK